MNDCGPSSQCKTKKCKCKEPEYYDCYSICLKCSGQIPDKKREQLEKH